MNCVGPILKNLWLAEKRRFRETESPLPHLPHSQKSGSFEFLEAIGGVSTILPLPFSHRQAVQNMLLNRDVGGSFYLFSPLSASKQVYGIA